MDQWNRAEITAFICPGRKKTQQSWLHVRNPNFQMTFACQPHICTLVFYLKNNRVQLLNTSKCLMKVEMCFLEVSVWGCEVVLFYLFSLKWSPCCRVWMSNDCFNTCKVYLEKQSTFEMAQRKLNPRVLSDAFWESLTLLSCSWIFLPRIVPLSSLVSKV